MVGNNGDRIKTLLNDIDREYQGFNHYQRAKFAIEQIGMWQQKFTEAKGKILKENYVDAAHSGGALGQYPEIEAAAED